jgi:hypothetical protein
MSSPSDEPIPEIDMSEEDQRFFHELTAELERDPPLQCELSFVWTGGNEEMAHHVATNLRVHAVLLRRKSPDLDFRALRRVTFSDNYEAALSEAAARVGRPVSPTREQGGLSFAMVVHGNDHCELVADSRLAWGLLSEDDKVRDFHINVWRHELVHIADCARQMRVWADEWLKAGISGLRCHFFNPAHASWSEYYANRVSDSSLSEGQLADEEEMLAAAIEDARESIKKQIREYRFSADLEGLRELAERKLRFIAMAAGYVLGRHAARGLEAPTTEKLRLELASANLTAQFGDAGAELGRLYDTRADWKSTACLLPLEETWRNVMATFGLRYEDHDAEGIYIRVP